MVKKGDKAVPQPSAVEETPVPVQIKEETEEVAVPEPRGQKNKTPPSSDDSEVIQVDPPIQRPPKKAWKALAASSAQSKGVKNKAPQPSSEANPIVVEAETKIEEVEADRPSKKVKTESSAEPTPASDPSSSSSSEPASSSSNTPSSSTEPVPPPTTSSEPASSSSEPVSSSSEPVLSSSEPEPSSEPAPSTEETTTTSTAPKNRVTPQFRKGSYAEVVKGRPVSGKAWKQKSKKLTWMADVPTLKNDYEKSMQERRRLENIRQIEREAKEKSDTKKRDARLKKKAQSRAKEDAERAKKELHKGVVVKPSEDKKKLKKAKAKQMKLLEKVNIVQYHDDNYYQQKK